MAQASGGRSTFGEQLRDDRIAAGLTQEQLAERSALSVRAIGDLERGRTGQPRRSTLRQLAEALSEPASDKMATASGPPRQLPAPTVPFVGRSQELAALSSLCARPAEHTGAAAIISAIGGTAGVGKTALALRWAYARASDFPDGQLYVNLRGYDPRPPVLARDALASFLRALGVNGQDVPQDLAECAARYRSLLAGRRMLILLDNARDAEQVRPLLPAASGCMALVTSRDALAGLVARDGARRLDLDLLTPPDTITLLRSLVGDRAESEPDALTALAAQCAGLPLALRVAAELINARRDTPLSVLGEELADTRRLLDLLDADGDPRTAVRGVFSWSYRYLDDAVARVFRLLGLHPGSTFEPHAAAALTDSTVEQASQMLLTLARAHLIQLTGQDRYSMHDLLRAYAAERADEGESAQAKEESLTRLFDYYVGTTAAAMDTLFPGGEARAASAPKPSTPAPEVADADNARNWLAANLATLVEIAAFTAGTDWAGHTTSLANAIFRYLEAGSRFSEIVAIYGHAVRAASRNGDRAAEAEALNNICLVDLRQGRYKQAALHLRRALELYTETENLTGQAYALGNLGIVDFLQGRYPDAIASQKRALALYRATGSKIGQARTLANLGLVELRLGQHDQAARRFQRSGDLSRQLGAVITEALALTGLGQVKLDQGNLWLAEDFLNKGLARFREAGNQPGEAEALVGLGLVRCAQHQPEAAIEHCQQALALSRRVGDPVGQASAFSGLAQALAEVGDTRQAAARATMALALADKAGDPYEQARAHLLLAGCNPTGAEAGAARRHRRRAAQLFASLGVTAPAERPAGRADLAARSPGVAHQQRQKLHKFYA
jgi:tetratricopeptide (TPR) repeat protein/transcriptional regulator with XRE-family HTH domain